MEFASTPSPGECPYHVREGAHALATAKSFRVQSPSCEVCEGVFDPIAKRCYGEVLFVNSRWPPLALPLNDHVWKTHKSRYSIPCMCSDTIGLSPRCGLGDGSCFVPMKALHLRPFDPRSFARRTGSASGPPLRWRVHKCWHQWSSASRPVTRSCGQCRASARSSAWENRG